MLIAKHQVAAAIEDTLGTAKAAVAADVVETLSADFSQQRNLISRQPASKSLSRGLEYIGRGQSDVTLEMDYKGSGTGVTAPQWGRLLRAAQLTEVDVVPLEFDVTQTTVDLRVGDLIIENVTTPTKVAVVVEDAATGAANVKAVVLAGTFSTNEAVFRHRGYDNAGVRVTASAGNLDETAVLGAAIGKAYVPYSRSEVTFAMTGAWTGGTPADGEVISLTSGGVVVGQYTHLATDGGNVVTAVPIWGTVVASATVASTTGKTNTVSGTPAFTQTEGLRLSVYSNRDTLRRALVGAMANYSLAGGAGESLRFSFELTGKNSDPTDVAHITGATIDNTTPPRLTSDDGYAYIDGVKLPLKNFSHTVGNTVALNADANASEGDQYAIVTARDPECTLDVDQVGVGGFDLWEKWKNARRVQVGIKNGTAAGNTLAFCVTSGQIESLQDGDAEGIATHAIGMRLRRYLEDGDDEFVIAHF